MEPSPILSVEFEHRRLVAGVVPSRALKVIDALPEHLKRIRLIRAAVVLLGAGAIAFATQRAGLPLTAAICVFLGALPVLWVMGWLSGFLLTSRQMARHASQSFKSGEFTAELAAQTTLERIRLEVRDEGLLLQRGAEQQQSVPWGQVGLTRLMGAPAAVLTVGPQDLLELPGSAFPDLDAFDAFCAAVLMRTWRAMRVQ